MLKKSSGGGRQQTVCQIENLDSFTKSVFLYLDLFLSHLGAKIKKNIFTVHESHFFFMK